MNRAQASADIYMRRKIPLLPPPPPPPPDAGGFTTTEADRLVVPPGPLHESSKVVFAVSAADCSVPLAGLLPLHPLVAVQAVASVALHCNVVRVPEVTEPGFAVNVRAGIGGGSATLNPYVPCT